MSYGVTKGSIGMRVKTDLQRPHRLTCFIYQVQLATPLEHSFNPFLPHSPLAACMKSDTTHYNNIFCFNWTNCFGVRGLPFSRGIWWFTDGAEHIHLHKRTLALSCIKYPSHVLLSRRNFPRSDSPYLQQIEQKPTKTWYVCDVPLISFFVHKLWDLQKLI